MVFSKCFQNYQNSSLKVSSKYIFHFHCHCLCLRICLWHCIFLVMVIFSHQSELMSQRPQVSKITLWRCSLNVFVIIIAIDFALVFVFVIVFLSVRSCFIITLIKCLKGHKCLGSLCVLQNQNMIQTLSHWLSDEVTYWAVLRLWLDS